MRELPTNVIKKIYDLMGDDLSKYIFENRLMYSLTEDKKFIRNVVCTIEKGNEIYKFLKLNPKRKIIFGAGSVGKRLVRIYDDITFDCLVDNHCSGSTYMGLPIINIEELKEKYKEDVVIISAKRYHEEIMQQLLEEGFKKEAIINLGMEYEKLSHLQYFDLPQLRENQFNEEIFVDGGCYDGNTSLDFERWNLGNVGGGIYAWEPEPSNQEKCRVLLEKNNINYEMIPKGLWNDTGVLKLKTDKDSSAISIEGDLSIEVGSIDQMISKPVTFIKMDIEGAEYQAILGAQKTIKKHTPRLAICVYHKLEDIWELPWLIHTINPKYRFYLRHYSFGDVETVLYAL